MALIFLREGANDEKVLEDKTCLRVDRTPAGVPDTYAPNSMPSILLEAHRMVLGAGVHSSNISSSQRKLYSDCDRARE